MISELNVTLIGDGSSDKALSNVVKWLLDDLYPHLPSTVTFADFRTHKNPPEKADIARQIEDSNKYYPFDFLVYHRDAESCDLSFIERRKQEVIANIPAEFQNKVVCAVPVKMMESWLLIDGEAIKRAAGNRNFKGPLNIPQSNKLEKITQPKDKLHELLTRASSLTGRKLNNFNVYQRVHLLAEYIEDFSVLRELESFRVFEDDLKAVVYGLMTTE